MKNLNFFSNKLALVAIMAISSIMLMSFQNAGSKKQSNCFAQVQTATPVLAQISGKMPALTSKLVIIVVNATTDEEHVAFRDGAITICGGFSDKQIAEGKEKKMSKF